MTRLTNLAIALLISCGFVGCTNPNAGHGNVKDYLFGRRHGEALGRATDDPLLAFAREITVMEDDLRRDGTITVKTPDVWGDANLVSFIQEYDKELEKTHDAYKDTLQAYLARSDQAEFSATHALGSALGGASVPETKVEAIELTDVTPFSQIANSKGRAPADGTLGIEPTESERQHSTYVLVNQALRRRNMGDDNSQMAGYGMYKFRIPVSVLPGRETSRNHAAVVTLRAQLIVDESNLRNTIPRLVVADLVDVLTTPILADWNNVCVPEAESVPTPVQEAESVPAPAPGGESVPIPKSNQSDVVPQASPPPITAPIVQIVYGSLSIHALRTVAEKHFLEQTKRPDAPKVQELRTFLFQYLAQIYRMTQARKAFLDQEATIVDATAQFERGCGIETYRTNWVEHMRTYCTAADSYAAEVSWLVAIQAGILDRNLKRILEDMQQSGKLSDNSLACADAIRFFEPDLALPQTLELWSALVKNEFPLTVFTLDPQVEEQNAFDAFSRRREMQVALAFGVASGRIRAENALKFSRQIALDSETITLNRTAVGFSHANDTFGWYFYPRIQSPPTENTNIGAIARTIWSTGPTEHYDTKHRELEPGIRECEVIVTMPSFVSKVAFDVTTNWEKLTYPGKTKRSYEEMVAQGSRVRQLQCSMQAVQETACSRPGDFARLASRVEQLEQLLGLQTYIVNVPYQYEQSGTDLFDTGDVHLAPVIQDFYGLAYLKSDKTVNARFFLRGKNFHPTLTHVVVGGTESHSVGDSATVEVISRELLLVHVDILESTLSPSAFEVRVGTPAGLSNPIEIPATPAPEQPKPSTANFDWSKTPLSFEAELLYDPMANPRVTFVIEDNGTILTYVAKTPLFPKEMGQSSEMIFLITARDSAGEELLARVPSQIFQVVDRKVPLSCLEAEIMSILNQDARVSTGRIPATIEVESLIRFEKWPFEKLGTPIQLKVHQRPGN